MQLLALVASNPPSRRSAELALADAGREARKLRDAIANQTSLAELVSRERADTGAAAFQSRAPKQRGAHPACRLPDGHCCLAR